MRSQLRVIFEEGSEGWGEGVVIGEVLWYRYLFSYGLIILGAFVCTP
jgi:hypothetical protein